MLRSRILAVPVSLVLAACNAPVAETTDGPGSSGAETAGSSATDPPAPTTDTGSESTGGTTPTTGADTEGPVSGPLQAGAAYGYITGPVGVSMAGYGLRTETNETPWNDVLNGSAGFYGYGVAKAIALEVEGERLVLLKLPTMSSEASITEGTIERLKELHGIDLTGRILTGATHSHHNVARYWRLPTPLAAVGADSPDEEVIHRVTTALAGVIKRAIDDLGPAEWGTAAMDDWDPDDLVYRDRRGENDPTYGKDPRLTILAVRRPGGAPMAAILNFGMHGTVFDSDNELLTEDAAGGLEMKFEERFFAAHGQPILGMFIQSGGGDASPSGDRLGHPGPARVELLGEDAAPRILPVYDEVEWRAEATLGVRSRRIDLTYAGIGYDEYPEFENAQGAPYTWGGWQCTGEGAGDDADPATSMEGKPKDCTSIEYLLQGFKEPVPHGEVHQIYLTVAALDDFYMVSLPGEPTWSVIKHLREELDARDVRGMAFGYSQDHMLYLTHPDDWFQGGYESEMSLWGPLAAEYLVARQMQLVDALRAGEPGPTWSEESPNLSLPKPFEPRAREASEDPGELLQDVPAVAERGATLRFGWGGGDPGLGEPHVVLEVDDGGGFAPVPAASGWPGAALDNSRYHMLTHYDPVPGTSDKLLPMRAHHWYVDFQVPLDLPAGDYRLVARGKHWDGAEAEHEVASATFTVTTGKADQLEATLDGDTLTLRWTHVQPAYEVDGDHPWPIAGYRLLDPTVPPDQPATVRAPLTIHFLVDGTPMGADHEVPWSDAGHVFDFGATGLPTAGLSVRAHLAADVVPAFVTADVVAP